MKKTLIIVLVIVGVISCSFLAAFAFYIIPYQKGNQLITYANKQGIVVDNERESDWISNSNLKAVQIVDNSAFQQEIYVDIDTDANYTFIALNKVAVTYDTEIEVKDWQTFETIGDYEKNIKIIFEFSNFKWQVINVNTSNSSIS